MKALLIVVGVLVLPSAAHAENPCDGFTWDVHVERALFAGAPQELAPATEARAAPAIEVSAGLYLLRLASQSEVRFAAPPGKKMLPDGAHAGLARVRLVKAGRYRVSLDVPAWIDVVAAGNLVPSRTFQGRSGCDAPHKVFEYDLPAGEVILQISGALPDRVRVVVTESPGG